MGPHERVGVLRAVGVDVVRRQVLPVAPGVRVDARSLLVRLVEERDQVRGRAADRREVGAVVHAVASVLDHQLRPRRHPVRRVAEAERRQVVARHRARHVRAVVLTVPARRVRRIVRGPQEVDDPDFPLRRIRRAHAEAHILWGKAARRVAEEAHVRVDARVEHADHLSLAVDPLGEHRGRLCARQPRLAHPGPRVVQEPVDRTKADPHRLGPARDRLAQRDELRRPRRDHHAARALSGGPLRHGTRRDAEDGHSHAFQPLAQRVEVRVSEQVDRDRNHRPHVFLGHRRHFGCDAQAGVVRRDPVHPDDAPGFLQAVARNPGEERVASDRRREADPLVLELRAERRIERREEPHDGRPAGGEILVSQGQTGRNALHDAVSPEAAAPKLDGGAPRRSDGEGDGKAKGEGNERSGPRDHGRSPDWGAHP